MFAPVAWVVVLFPFSVTRFASNCCVALAVFLIQLFVNVCVALACALLACAQSVFGNLSAVPLWLHASFLRSAAKPRCRRKWTVARIKAVVASTPPVQTPLLPPSRCTERLCVVLDLDHTCVFAVAHAAAVGEEAVVANPTCETHLIRVNPNDKEIFEVRVRPNVRQFIEQVSRFAEVCVFTAGKEQYARAVCSLLDPFQLHFSAILSRESTIRINSTLFIKDLSRLGRNLERVVLIDDSAHGFILQPHNGLPVSCFRGCPYDNQLFQVVMPILQSLAVAPDVRPILAATFDMDAWFRQRGLA